MPGWRGRPLLAHSHFQALWISPFPWRGSPVGKGGRVFLGQELRVASPLSSGVDCGPLFSNRACLEHRCWEYLNPWKSQHSSPFPRRRDCPRAPFAAEFYFQKEGWPQEPQIPAYPEKFTYIHPSLERFGLVFRSHPPILVGLLLSLSSGVTPRGAWGNLMGCWRSNNVGRHKANVLLAVLSPSLLPPSFSNVFVEGRAFALDEADPVHPQHLLGSPENQEWSLKVEPGVTPEHCLMCPPNKQANKTKQKESEILWELNLKIFIQET